MGTIMVSGNATTRAGARRNKPKLALKGRRRKATKKLLLALNVILNQDATEAAFAEKNGFVPYLIFGSTNSVVARQAAGVAKRCSDALASKVS